MPININVTLRANKAAPLTWIEGDANWSLLIANDQFLDSTKVDKIAGKGLSTNDFTNTLKNKLDGVQNGATANQTDTFLRSRANHTGTQTMDTISNAGSAATANVVVNKSDPTANRVLTVGYGSLGALDNLAYEGGPLNADTYRTGGTIFGSFNILGALRAGYLTTIPGDSSTSLGQVFLERQTGFLFTRTQLGAFGEWTRKLSAGEFGFGIPLGQVPIADPAAPIADATAGVQFGYLNGALLPPGVADGALMTMAYNTGYAAQVLFDWRTGKLWTKPTAADIAPNQPWESVGGTYGTSTNGEFWRFQNGLQICKIKRDVDIAVTQAATGVFFGNGPVWTFPAPFVGSDVPLIVQVNVSPGVITWEAGAIANLTSVTAAVIAMVSIASRVFTQQLVAIGKWK